MDSGTHCYRNSGMPRAEGLSHCLVLSSWEFSQHRGRRGLDRPSNSSLLWIAWPPFWNTGINHHWRQPHVQMDQKFLASPWFQQEAHTNDMSDRHREKISERDFQMPLFCPPHTHHFCIVRPQILKLGSCSQSMKASKTGQYLLQEGIRVGDEPGINRKLGVDFQGAPEIPDMLSLKCKRRRAEQKYIGFMGDLED